MPHHPTNPMATAPHDPPYPPFRPHAHPPHPPPFSLSDSDTAILSQSSSDFFALLRSNPFACQWILQWLLTSAAIDTSSLNLSLSRGYRSAYMCASRACASIDSQTLLQNTSTLLLPVESRDSLVVGFYVESSSDQAAPQPVRMGKYVYYSSSRALFKVAKVRGPPSSSGLLSICITRTNIVGTAMYINDFVMVSFPWQPDTTTVPSQCIVHSRTLAFYKLFQTAEQAGLAGHASLPDVVTPNPDMTVSESSFYGLASFGIYEGVLLPSRLCSGMRTERAEPPSLSCGNWAVPEHFAFCRGHRVLHMGIFREEMNSLRSQFVQAYGQPSPLANRFSSDPSPTFEETTRPPQRHDHTQPIQQEREQRTSQPIIPYPQQTVGYDNRVVTDFEYDKEVPSTPVHNPASVSTPLPLHPSTRHGSVLVDVAISRGITVDSAVTGANTIPPDISTSVMLPMHRLTSATGQSYHPVEQTLQEVPSSVVDSIQAVVSAQRPSTEEKRPSVSASMPAPGRTVATSLPPPPPPPSTPPLPASTESAGVENKPPAQKKEQAFSMQTFKKTLPAPTKSEIVIRNRISAQRSNEKRRRRIEATRTELAYLKTTYLPQLENKRGGLISENQNLKLKFMEKYHESDIDSFF